MGYILKAGGSLLVMASVVGLSMLGSQFAEKLNVTDRLLQAEKENRELTKQAEKLAMANRLLKVNYLMAKVRLKSQTKENGTGKLLSVVEFLEVDDQENPLGQPLEVRIHGGELYVDGLVAIFDDEYVEAGDPRRGTALFAFRRLFGDDDAPSSGYLIPSNRSQPGAYAQGGLPTKLEEKFWADFWPHAHDEAWMKANGLRGLQGTAPSVKLQEGFDYRVRLGARGDVTIETKATKGKSDVLNSSRRAKSWRSE